MPTNANAVFAGGPDRVAGAIRRAPLGTALPTDISTAVNAAFLDAGFISEDGLTLSQDMSWEEIKEWGGDTVRRIMSNFTGSLSWTFLETNSVTTKATFGSANVTAVAATTTAGSKLTIKLNSDEAERGAWVFNIKDGLRKIRIVVPDGQITDRGELSFTKQGAVSYPVTLQAIPDASGTSIYVYTDDGVFATV